MSVAGKRSLQGDEYQMLIGLKWAIQLLSDESINFIQLESTGIPEIEGKVTVDDIIVFYQNGTSRFIQAKKTNQAISHGLLKIRYCEKNSKKPSYNLENAKIVKFISIQGRHGEK